MKRILLLLAFLNAVLMVSAQAEKEAIRVLFPRNVATINEAYRGNGTQLQNGLPDLQEFARSGDKAKQHIVVTGSSSPDGTERVNAAMSQRRAEALAQYIYNKVGVDQSQVTIRNNRVDWAALRQMILDDPRMANANHVVYYLNGVVWSIEDGQTVSDREVVNRLKRIDGGRHYNYIATRLFPRLRYAKATVEDIQQPAQPKKERGVIIVESEEPAAAGQPDAPAIDLQQATGGEATQGIGQKPDESGAVAPIDTANADNTGVSGGFKGIEVQRSEYPDNRKKAYFALKSNLLYDAALVPNVGVEVYVGKNLSVEADYIGTWLFSKANHKYWQCYGGEVGVRRWFGRKAANKPLTGHHVGLYAQAMTYDIEHDKLGDSGYQSDKWSFGVGLSYGYSAPIARRLNFDFTIGLGYFGGNYKEYKPYNGLYQWEGTNRLNWFGPTKAEVSLVWLLGHGNVNHKKKKGGRR